MNERELQEQIDQLNTDINLLCDKRHRLQLQQKEYTHEQNLKRFKAWNLKTNDCVVLFAKEPNGYHWCIAKAMRIVEIDEKHEYMDTIMHNYGEADYEYWHKSERVRVSFDTLKEFELNYNVYITDEVQLAILCQWMNNLDLDYKNYKKYEDAIAKQATMSIKIPLK